MRLYSRRRLKTSDGYTLTEMLVVIGIIGLIAAVLTPTLLGQMQRARAKAAKLQLETIVSAVELYRSDVDQYPTTEQGLGVLVSGNDIPGWTGPYLKDARTLRDPWNGEIEYERHADGTFLVRSLGANGREGGGGADVDLTAPATVAPTAGS
jgi:general secretion pathway protein G